MALSDYGYNGNDVLPMTPLDALITGFLKAVNKVYRAVHQSDYHDLVQFLADISENYFKIWNFDNDYLWLAERVMFNESYHSSGNVFKRTCYFDETTGDFILFNKEDDNARVAERNYIQQVAVDNLIASGFQTSMLPFYYTDFGYSGYRYAPEFASFYRPFAYPISKDYLLQRIAYLSLLRVYTEYRLYYLYSNSIIYERCDIGQSDNDIYAAFNDLQFNYHLYNGGNAYYLNVELYRYSSDPNNISFYIAHAIKSSYIPKRIIDEFIYTYNDDNIFNKFGVWQFSSYNIMGNNEQIVDGKWSKLDMSTVYSITYTDSNNNVITEDCYKIFDYNNLIAEQLRKLNAVNVNDLYISTTYYCEWYNTDSNSYLTTISDCFEFSDI